MIRTDCHTFDPRYIFTPHTSAQNPGLFLPKIVTQSPIFVTLSRILEIFHSKTPNELWNLRKRYPNAAYFFMAFVTERPIIFLPCIRMFEGNVAPSNTVRSWKILYSRNRIEQFGEYFQVQI